MHGDFWLNPYPLPVCKWGASFIPVDGFNVLLFILPEFDHSFLELEGKLLILCIFVGNSSSDSSVIAFLYLQAHLSNLIVPAWPRESQRHWSVFASVPCWVCCIADQRKHCHLFFIYIYFYFFKGYIWRQGLQRPEEDFGFPEAGVTDWVLNFGPLEEQQVLFNFWAISPAPI